MNNIILIGFSACYKSSAGKALAKKLNRKFYDSDKTVEKITGMSVKEIFEVKGEKFFRDTENAVLKELSELECAVISCGGGSALSPCFTDLANSGTVVWLKAEAKTVFKRLNGKTRPLFDRLTFKELEKKVAERNSVYEKFADVTVATDGKYSKEVAENILSALKNFDKKSYTNM